MKKNPLHIFTDHPNSIKQTYLQHAFFAIKTSFLLLFLSFTAFTHAIFPFLFKTTTSDHLIKIADKLKQRLKK